MLSYLQQLLEERGHAVICVAEGAGQNLMYPGRYGWVRGSGPGGGAGMLSHELREPARPPAPLCCSSQYTSRWRRCRSVHGVVLVTCLGAGCLCVRPPAA